MGAFFKRSIRGVYEHHFIRLQDSLDGTDGKQRPALDRTRTSR
jgi:hypothetical protein